MGSIFDSDHFYIIEFTLDDWEELSLLWKSSFDEVDDNFLFFLKEEIVPRSTILLLKSSEGVILSSLMAQHCSFESLDLHNAASFKGYYLSYICTQQQSRGCGYFKSLLNYFIDKHTVDLDFIFLRPRSDVLAKTYMKFGFTLKFDLSEIIQFDLNSYLTANKQLSAFSKSFPEIVKEFSSKSNNIYCINLHNCGRVRKETNNLNNVVVSDLVTAYGPDAEYHNAPLALFKICSEKFGKFMTAIDFKNLLFISDGA